ncbi:MAG: hypothetical protein D6769_00830 [Methanobacteriota archaeon]|nr:MAG: hypothetical protein D6769_00830 [Euryarchaeota archaeon]
MKVIEAAFVFFVVSLMLSHITVPPRSGISYEQQYVLANDIYLELYREFGSSMYGDSLWSNISERADRIGEELSLCIYVKEGSKEKETCPIERGAYIDRSVNGKEIVVGVGK